MCDIYISATEQTLNVCYICTWWTTWHWGKYFSDHFYFPVSIIPPVFRDHSFIYHWRNV